MVCLDLKCYRNDEYLHKAGIPVDLQIVEDLLRPESPV